MNQKRRFTPEFIKEAVALVTEQDYTIAKAASLGISAKTLRTWVTLALNRSDGVLSDDERAELKRLSKENKELRLEKEILKKASVDSIGQRNSHVKTWGCGGFLNETDIYSKGKSICF